VSLISLIVVLVIVGLILYCVNAFIPMDATVKKILNIAVVVFLIIWLLQATGLLSGVNDIRIGD
jgi:hypothetical protein